jgi:hypothetical protein|nr:MAG TPA: restriction endonuclease [Caudoviricetes sp.]
METKRCNKCGREKPLSDLDSRKNKKTGEMYYLSLCKACRREYQNQYCRANKNEINRKQRERSAKKRAEKKVLGEPKSRVCKCCKQEKPIDSFYKKYPNRDGNLVYDWKCKACKREAYREKHGVKPVPKPPKPSVWDLTVMPKISVEHTVQIANEAFPLLSNQYWKVGEAKKIYKQFGMKWSYL